MQGFEIGGAVVRRRIGRGADKPFAPGDFMTPEQVKALSPTLRRIYQESQQIEVFYVQPLGVQDRHLVPAGKGTYHVVEGRYLTTTPVSKAVADAIVKGGDASEEDDL